MALNNNSSLATVFHLIGLLLLVLGGLLFIPLIMILIYHEYDQLPVFMIPAFLSLATGYCLYTFLKPGRLFFLQSMLVCGLSWVVLSLFAALPFFLGTSKPLLDCYFETVSGMTTTGITIYTRIGEMSHALIFWRSLIQWLGGLGMLTLFLAITFRSNGAYFHLFSAEAHKIDSARPTPSIFKTAAILWSVYAALTFLEMLILSILGMSAFDALCHSLTTLSTGGFSPYDSSIDYYRQAGFANYKAIEYVMTLFMFFGGVNFLVHYKALTGRFKEVFRDLELRAFLSILGGSVLLIMLNHFCFHIESLNNLEEVFRKTIFTVVSVITTTGYGTEDINNPFFPAMAKQILLILMLVGGCVGSTAGGIKTLRIVVLWRLFKNQILRLRLPRTAMCEVVIDKKIFPQEEVKRITGLFFGWLFLILVGGMITAAFTDLDSWQSFSGMFSAVGNIGPCYFSVQQMSELPGIVKITYILGMLAGRLEILPVLLLFSRKAWKN